MRQFNSAAKQAASVENPVDIEFEINGTTLVASPPSSGQLTLFMAAQAGGDAPEIAKAMLELLWAVLGEDNYRWLEGELKAGVVDLELVEEVIEFLGETWSARPTSPASVSPSSRTSTGKQSTAAQRRKASTRST
jgi:hypothetical protein